MNLNRFLIVFIWLYCEKVESVSNNIDYFHPLHNTYFDTLQNGCCRKTDHSLCQMCCIWTLLFTILTTLLMLVPTASGECCHLSTITFNLREGVNEPCPYFEDAFPVYNKRRCYVKLCGSLKKPTPCCGRGKCNIFCCNCDNGCHYRNKAKFIIEDFGKFYFDLVYNVRIYWMKRH